MVWVELATRAQALVLKAFGVKMAEIVEVTNIKLRNLQYILSRARQRGWSGAKDEMILDGHLIEKRRTGRPRKYKKEFDEKVIDAVTTDRFGREKSCAYIASQL
ncbi:hypothetical protein K402DRAFT_340493, partial [Aulographum hederae CBS 113979]